MRRARRSLPMSRRTVLRVLAFPVLAVAFGLVALGIAELILGALGSRPARVRVYAGDGAPNAASLAPTELRGIEEVATGLFLQTPTGRRLRPNTVARIENHPTSGRDVVIRTNPLGHRNPTLGAKRERRVLFLGDSITCSAFLPEEDTFVRLVQTLSEQGGEPLETINAGVGAIGLETELAILLETGLATDPDVVVVGFYLNDVQDSPGVEQVQLPGWLRWSRVAGHLATRLPALVAARQIAHDPESWRRWKEQTQADHPPGPGDPLTDRAAFNRRILIDFWDWGSAWSDGAWQRMEPVFEELARLAEEHDFQLLLVAFPVRIQVEASFLDDTPQRKLAAIAERIGAPLLDTLPLLRAAHAETAEGDEGLFYDHAHHTPRAQRLIAEWILAFIRRSA